MITHDYVHDGPDPGSGSGARAREPLHVHDEPAPPARERRRELGADDAEHARLAARFGTVLRHARGHLTQQQLADRAKLHRVTISRLEEGRLRPTTSSVWDIARVLRPDLRSRVALDERLPPRPGRACATMGGGRTGRGNGCGWSCACRPGTGCRLGTGTTLGVLIVAELAARASGARPL
jgi:transcriptional regulator with XRE-family HTH domain